MQALLKVIAEPRRVAILRLVRNRERSAGEIAQHFEVTRPAISQHLRVLVGAGLLAERRAGTKRLYRLQPDRLLELRRFLEEFWDTGLERMKRAAEQAHRREARHGRRTS
jgi:DNA-binding transcriptional ArsR family regulator